MINNTPISQIHIIQQHQAKHKRRLQKILQSRPARNQYNLSKNFMHMLQTKRMNHEKWKQFNRSRQRDQLTNKNERMFNKLIDITVSEGPYHQAKTLVSRKLESSAQKSFESMEDNQNSKLKQSKLSTNSKQMRSTSLHHNYQIINVRRSRMIDEQNPKLAQRIMQKTGDLNHLRDLEEYRKTREIMGRLQKFNQIKRVINNSRQKDLNFSQPKIRSKTLPAPPRQIKINNIRITRGKLEELTPHKQEIKIPTISKRSSNQDKRYRTIESIRQQTENNVSEQFSKKQAAKLPSKEQYQVGDQDQLMDRYLDAERKFTR